MLDSTQMHLIIPVPILNYQGSPSSCLYSSRKEALSLSSGRNDTVEKSTGMCFKSTGNALYGKHTIPGLDS